MAKAVLIVSILLLAACGDRKEERFATWEDAKRAGAIERGWVPPFVPTTARDIRLVHDLDTNAQQIAFAAPPDAIEGLIASVTPATTLTGTMKRRAAVEAGEGGGDAEAVTVLLMCAHTVSATLVVNRRSGSVVYREPAEWAKERCPRPL